MLVYRQGVDAVEVFWWDILINDKSLISWYLIILRGFNSSIYIILYIIIFIKIKNVYISPGFPQSVNLYIKNTNIILFSINILLVFNYIYVTLSYSRTVGNNLFTWQSYQVKYCIFFIKLSLQICPVYKGRW